MKYRSVAMMIDIDDPKIIRTMQTGYPDDEVVMQMCPVCHEEAEILYYSNIDETVVGCDICIDRKFVYSA